MAAKLPLFKHFLVPHILISFKNICSKGYISFTGMHFVDASDYHTLIIKEYDVYLLVCKLDSSITRLLSQIFLKLSM